jgi:hypothetical protein
MIIRGFDVLSAVAMSGLHWFDVCPLANLGQIYNQDTVSRFFDNVLPKIVKLALALPEVCGAAIPLLHQRDNYAITLSQHQV